MPKKRFMNKYEYLFWSFCFFLVLIFIISNISWPPSKPKLKPKTAEEIRTDSIEHHRDSIQEYCKVLRDRANEEIEKEKKEKEDREYDSTKLICEFYFDDNLQRRLRYVTNNQLYERSPQYSMDSICFFVGIHSLSDNSWSIDRRNQHLTELCRFAYSHKIDIEQGCLTQEMLHSASLNAAGYIFDASGNAVDAAGCVVFDATGHPIQNARGIQYGGGNGQTQAKTNEGSNEGSNDGLMAIAALVSFAIFPFDIDFFPITLFKL
jgi:hypothetical protein